MSAALSASRANSRPNKNPKATAQQIQTTKTEGPPAKMQPTPEQIRMAQMISDTSNTDDEELKKKIEQIKELTNRSSDEVQIALHDCENDTERAVNYLLEKESDQGEWRETGKKKKRPTPTPTTVQKTEITSNHIDEKTDKREKSPDRDQKDRPEFSSRRGRRNDSRPPRLSRGRGRERPDYFRADKEDGENDKDDSPFGREKNFERGRGRGRGRGGPRRARGGGNRFNRGNHQSSAPKFDAGPQIDTWTNETAENAEKETSGFGDTWVSEDWNEDCWSGSLNETQVFTSKSVSETKVFTAPTEQSVAVQGSVADNLGTRLDLGALMQKPQPTQSPESSFSISQYNQQATESIKNSIGIGSGSRSMLSEQLTMSPQPSVGQLSSYSQNSVMNQTLVQSSPVSRLPTSQPMVAQPPPPQQQPAVSITQRPKPQRSKLPPPSKIPASAVEMPGKMVTSLDVQFGNLEFGADTSPFSFGSGNDSSVSSTYTETVSNSSPPLSNHMSQINQSGETVISTSIRSAVTPNKSQMAALDQTSPRPSAYPTSTFSTPPKKDINQVNKMSPPEAMSYPGSPGERKASPLMGQRSVQTSSSLAQGLRFLSKPDAESLSSFNQSQANYQSSGYQSRTQTGIASSSPYPHVSSSQTVAASYPAQFPGGSHQYQTSQNQYQANPNQYQTNKKTFQNYQSGSSSFQNQSGYSASSNQGSLYQTNVPTSTFQTQTAQNLYQVTSTPNSFQTQANSAFHSRDSQSSSNFQTAVTQASSTLLRDSQGSSFPRDTQNSVSYQRDGQSSFQRDGQSSAFPRDSTQSSFPRETQTAYQRESQSAGSTFGRSDSQTSAYPRESAGSYTRDSQSSSSFPRETPAFTARDGQSSTGYQRETASAAAAGGSFQRDPQNAGSVYPRDSQAAGSYTRETQANSTFPRENQSAASFSRDAQSAAFPRDSQTKTSFPRESQNAASFPRESQNVPTFQRENTGASSYQRDGTTTAFQRDGQTSSSFQRDSQSSGSFSRDSQNSSSFSRETQSAAAFSRDNQSSFPRDGQSSFQRDSQSATVYQREGQSTSFPRDGQTSSAFSTRDGQSSSNFQRDAQSASAFQREGQTSSSFPREAASSLTAPTTQNQTNYSTQNFTSGHQANLQTSPLTTNKLGETLSKISVKENSLDATTTQFDGTTSTSTTSLTSLASLTTTTSSTSLASVTTAMVTATASTTTISSTSTKTTTLPVNTSKAPPNLTAGVPPLLSHQYIMGQAGTLPPFYPLYSYEDLQLLQQRLPLQNNYYDMGGFPGVSTTITGREQNTLANVQYTAATDNKMTRVDAQSPIPTSQQQSSQSAHQQPYINLNYGYYYPTLVPGAGFQYPAMFPMPPVTNTAHAGTTPNSQYPKTHASHAYTGGRGYDDLTQTADFTKTAYGMQQGQAKVSGSVSVTSVAGTSDMAGYGKTHAQAFDKQGYAGTPPPFNMPLATGTQTGHMGAPTTPYATPFVPVMAHQPQPHSQMMHLLQDSTGGSTRGSHSQTASQPKSAGSKPPYTAAYWPGN
ncbi:hypothetical protein ScPMuIL_018978 [Solemya velum]